MNYKVTVGRAAYEALQLDIHTRAVEMGVQSIEDYRKGALITGTLDQLEHFADFFHPSCLSEDLPSADRRACERDRQKILAFVAKQRTL